MNEDKKPKKAKPKKAKPYKEISKDIFEGLCSIQCTEKDICTIFHCSIPTLIKWCKRTYGMTFEEVFEIKSIDGKIALRRLQFQSAKEGSVPMQIFLGKQWLGQRDKPEDAPKREDTAADDLVESLLAELDED